MGFSRGDCNLTEEYDTWTGVNSLWKAVSKLGDESEAVDVKPIAGTRTGNQRLVIPCFVFLFVSF